jgi:hypothetical protein
MTLKKTTLLFEENIYEKLKEKAILNKVSIGEMVREAVANYYKIKTKKEKSMALLKLSKLECVVPEKYEDLEKEILEGMLSD